MTDRIGRHELSRMMHSAATRIREQQPRLSQLDCVAGDGDHGTTMLRIMERLEAEFRGDTASDLKRCFCDAGWNVMGCDGGASSSLLGAFFLGVGDATQAGVSSWECAEFAAGFEIGLLALQSQTKARPGDKTLMDALIPAVQSLVAEAKAGHDISHALQAAARAASQGASATENMVARFGRARLLGDKTKGHQDPGAVSVALIFEGFAEAILN
jgi:dihydroxyacetone kinase-like protein